MRMQALYARFPELQQLPAAAEPTLPRNLSRLSYMGGQLDRMDERHEARVIQERTARRFAERASWVSPPVAFTLALERMAGVGPEAASAYRSWVVRALHERVRWVLVKAWTKAPLDQASFEGLVAAAPAAFRWESRRVAGPTTVLFGWLILGWLVAVVRLSP